MNNKLRVLAMGLLLGVAPMAALPANSAQAGEHLNLERSVESFRQHANQMKSRELRAYIRQLKANINSENRRDYRAKIRVLRSELKARRASKNQRAAKKTKRTGAEQKLAQATNTNNNKVARRYLRKARPSGELNARQLRARIAKTQQMLDMQDLRKGVRRDLNLMLQRDRGEYTVKTGKVQQQQPETAKATRKKGTPTQAATQAGQDPNREAQDVLSDQRAAQQLSEEQLRARLQRNRRALRSNRVDTRNANRLRERLRQDRTELRSRVRASRTGTKVEQPQQNQNYRNALLGQTRPAHSVRTPNLSLRVQRTRNLLAGGNLTAAERNRLQNLLERDRRELRTRWRHRRDRRRGDLAGRVRNNDINIVISPWNHYEPREDIAFAEAEDGYIERQLVAPARRQLKRRYTFDEYRRTPQLRDAMPAVDVDTINFGFNESFVREEEIDQLERLGAVIERIVAKHPDEVFLIEGHTDAVGSGEYNLGLSQQRAEAIRSALLEYFVIEPRNLTTIGYGEQYLKVYTEEPEEENRRVSIRRITPVLATN